MTKIINRTKYFFHSVKNPINRCLKSLICHRKLRYYAKCRRRISSDGSILFIRNSTNSIICFIGSIFCTGRISSKTGFLFIRNSTNSIIRFISSLLNSGSISTNNNFFVGNTTHTIYSLLQIRIKLTRIGDNFTSQNPVNLLPESFSNRQCRFQSIRKRLYIYTQLQIQITRHLSSVNRKSNQNQTKTCKVSPPQTDKRP